MTVFHSLWAFAFLLILAVVAAINFLFRKKRTPSLVFSSLALFKNTPKTLRARLFGLPTILKFIAIIFMIVALARPQKADVKIRNDVEGVDIILLVDLSLTMMIEDMSGNSRLEAAKKVQIEFVKNRPDDRIGIVAFAGEAFTAVPLTLDHRIVNDALMKMDNTNRLKDGTAQGVAIATGVARLKDSTAKSRIMVFVTDGENNTGYVDPDTALEIAMGYGIKIYVVGVGSDGRKKLPVKTKDVFGNTVRTYQDMESTFYEDQMMKIAEKTGGKYWRSRNLQELKDVYGEIDRLEKTKVEGTTYTKYQELFNAYLWIALALYALGWLLANSILQRGPV